MSTSPNQKKSALSRRGFFKATAAAAAVSSVFGRMERALAAAAP